MTLYIQVSERSDKSIFRLAILVWRSRMNTIPKPPCIYLNTDKGSDAEGFLAFNNDNCSQDSIASSRNFAAHTAIPITKFHV